MKRLIILLLLGWQVAAWANYVEVRRNSYIYEDASRHSEKLDHIKLKDESERVYLALAQESLKNGYYKVGLREGSGHGWIYKSLVRQYEGFPPGHIVEPTLNIVEDNGAINVYFNKSVLTNYALENNQANARVNLENRLISRLQQATTTLDIAVYEINLPGIVDAVMERASNGVAVRIIADAKVYSDETDDEHIKRYDLMRLYLERLLRGQDGQFGTDDDSALFSDGLIFAVTDEQTRQEMGLPARPDDLPFVTHIAGNDTVSGNLVAEGELKTEDEYFTASEQMHNKFAIIDGEWVFTGSWNWTITGLYGTNENRTNGILDGNQQHVAEIHSSELAQAYTVEFNEMWGSDTRAPNPENSNFHRRKSDNTPHTFTIGGRTVELYFSPGDDVLARIRNLITQDAHHSVYFSIFAWSDQGMVDALKIKWEGDIDDRKGTLTGFDIKGLFDVSFWNQYWSASINMTGRTASKETTNNPNLRWANPAPVFRDNENRKLHSKTMSIDACTDSDPTVIIGSTNWSNNGNNVNDENLLIIHDGLIANQFLQEFYARYQNAGGVIPLASTFSCIH